MSMYNNLNKIIIFVVLFFGINTQAMIVGVSSLKQHFNHQKNPHTVVLLYDQHALNSDDPIKQNHTKEMRLLIEALAEYPHNVPFFVELSERQKDNTTTQSLPMSPGNIPIHLAIDHNMKFKNISFNSFDIRTHCDYWMRDMLSQRKEFAQAINQNHKFPFHFYNVTGTNFLQHLKDRHNLINHLIEKIPFGESCKNQEYVKSKKVYDDCNKMISSLLQQHRCDIQKHIFNLINNLTTLEANTLGIMLLEEQSFAVEINLLSHILELTHKNPLCIVLAGMYHCHNIEKRMLSQFESFEKDESQSMISPGMVLDNLFQLQLPKYVPESFLPKIAQKSIDEFQIRSNK